MTAFAASLFLRPSKTNYHRESRTVFSIPIIVLKNKHLTSIGWKSRTFFINKVKPLFCLLLGEIYSNGEYVFWNLICKLKINP